MIPKIHVRAPFNYDADLASEESGLICVEEEDRTQQNFAQDCDINVLVRRFGVTGVFPEAREAAEFGEFDMSLDLHGLLNQLRRGEAAFMELPPEIREKFGNEPVQLLEALQTQERHADLVEMGILKAPAAPVAAVEASGASEGAA